MSRHSTRSITRMEGKEMHSEQVMRHKEKLENARLDKKWRIIGNSVIAGWFLLTAVCYAIGG